MDVILRQLSQDNSTEPRSYTLNVGPTLVGRSDNCSLILSSQSVSRWHCILDVTSDGLYVTDLHSLNGTYVNDRRVIRLLLKSDDRLRIGTVPFVVDIDSADEVSIPSGSFALRVLPRKADAPPKALATTDFSNIPAVSPPRRRRPPAANYDAPSEKSAELSAPTGADGSQMVRYEKALNDCSAQLRLLIEKVAVLEAKLDALGSRNDGAQRQIEVSPHTAFERHDALMYVARAAVCDKVRQKNLPSKSA
ncbi:MAG: FHA domain-containing protein [Actinobacteria bacterium]|nr:FHA domain-containing protein [Actinomycetota bacterium]